MPINWPYLFLSLEGRITRSQFWTGVAAIVFFQLMVQVPAMRLGQVNPDLGNAPVWFRNLSLLLDVICAWPLFAVLSKRQQDRGQHPQLSLFFVTLLLTYSTLEAFGMTQSGTQLTPLGWIAGLPLMLVIVIVVAELGFRPGTNGPNAYGPDPLQ